MQQMQSTVYHQDQSDKTHEEKNTPLYELNLAYEYIY